MSGASAKRSGQECLRIVRAGMLAVPSRVQQRMPHLTAHDSRRD